MVKNDAGIWVPDYKNIFVLPSKEVMAQRKLDAMEELAEIRAWGLRNPVKWIEFMFGVELLDIQKYAIQMSWNKKYALWLATRNMGKALALDTPIPTPDGYKLMSDLEIGDYVFGDDGEPTQIVNTSPIFYDHTCYKVSFEDGEEIIADADHLWEVKAKDCRPAIRVLNTEQMSNNFVHRRKDGKGVEYKYRVKISSPLEYPKKDLPIHPYILGVWLGDGCSEDGYITSHISDSIDMISNIESFGYFVSSVKEDSGNNYRIRIQDEYGVPLKTLLRENDLLDNKHIPNIYFTGSVEQRLYLLQGLMDTDGFVAANSTYCEFSQKSEQLIIDFCKLLDSLSIKYSKKYRSTICNGKYFDSYRIQFYSSKEFPCVKMQRKFNRLPDKTSERQKYKSIVNIEKVPTVPTKCIRVDNNSHLFLCGTKNTVTHNSTLVGLYIMARTMLVNNCRCYICSGTATQSAETYLKIENIAKDKIESFLGLTDIYLGEVVTTPNSDGWVHNPAGFTYSLYNGSFVKTINSNVDASRGFRAELCVLDECAFLGEEVFQVIEPFTAQDKNFRLGKDKSGKEIDVKALPRELPNQMLYCSSAGEKDGFFYTKYKQYALQQMCGSRDHMVLDVNCDVMMKATKNGRGCDFSLLDKQKVDNAMRENKEKALREYYNIFTSDGGADAIFKRSMIVKNSTIRPPIMFNDTKDRLFALAYDPARSMDNSFVLVGEYYKDSSDNWRMRIANGINFMDLSKKNKTPMRTPEQVKKLKQLILDYNGDGVDDYTNISNIFIDAGSGGAGVNIADYLMEDWYEEGHEGEQKYLHRGLIDKEQSSDYVKKFPNAVDKIRLLPPTMYKSIIYEAAIEMMRLDLIDFTAEYDNKGYLTMLDIDEKEMAKAKKDLIAKYKDKSMSKGELDRLVEEELQERNLASTKIYKLSPDEELGLVQIDSLKEEMVNMVRKKRESGKDGFELSTEKQNKLHDDRSYCFSMLCYGLSELRREHIKNKKRPKKENIAAAMPIRKGVVRKMFS